MRGPLDLKLNRAGSWLHVCGFDGEKLDAVKTACDALVHATGGRVSFKVVTVGGGTVAHIDARSTGPNDDEFAHEGAPR